MTHDSLSHAGPPENLDRMRREPADIRVIDLFAGAGGLTTGFAATGRFQPVGAVELDEHAAATYALNHGERVHVGDIAAYAAGSFPRADVVLGGPPCQGFSLLGKRDADDPRNRMWEQYLRVLQRVRPAFFVIENVPQFLDSRDFRSLVSETGVGGRLQGWELEAWTLNAADHGAAQNRRRAIIVGRRTGIRPLGRPEPGPVRMCLVDVLDDLDRVPGATELPASVVEVNGSVVPGAFKARELHFMPPMTALSRERFRHIPYGGSRLDLPDHLQARCWRGNTRSAADVMGRIVWEKPSITLRTEFFRPEKGRFLHPDQDRPITHHEAARIQGFPDDYLWAGTRSSIARQIGNAVPPPLARAVADRLLARL
ncbi:DNA cytosine methyltransferase [Cellulomonas sp. 179-A 9B4 NHS]|uniref:DNA cytosine methyltransferase n=1 Tax=Cellulomonas sp. 179-A 9B4 NHS TaxID=3142379 RepID=UPI0039A3E0C1